MKKLQKLSIKHLYNNLCIFIFAVILLESEAFSKDTKYKKDTNQNLSSTSFKENSNYDFNFDDLDLDQNINEKNSGNENLISDPFEKVNRKIFDFNEFIDIYFIQYIAKGYRYYTPGLIKTGIHNFVINIQLPLSTVYSLAQFKIDNSVSTFSTFLINSTIGVFGFFDIAGTKKIKYNNEDLGQVFAHYNIPSGPFLMLPILGPRTMRDAFADIANITIDPFSLNLVIKKDFNILTDKNLVIINSISNIDRRENIIDIIDDVRKDSFDKYSAIRTMYIQNRNYQIKK